MNRAFIQVFLLASVVCLSVFPSLQARAEDEDLAYSVSFTDQDLDELLAPIALYPDPLLAQMLPASTYPDEVSEAAAWVGSGGDLSSINEQIWDESVKAVARYPDVLQMMGEYMDWTANLGDTFLNQPEDVADAIQRLRWRARAAGNLVSNDEQTVIVDGDFIQIVPAQPQYMFVPLYDPSIVYVEAYVPGAPPFITYGVGLVIGGWLTMDFDWHRRHVIYHGWDRPGWVTRARPYVHVRNVYINRNRPLIRPVWRHDRSHGDPARYLASRPSGPKSDEYRRFGEAGGRGTSPPKGMFVPRSRADLYSNRGRESRGIVVRQPPAESVVRARPNVPTIGRRPEIPPSGPTQRTVTAPTERPMQPPRIGSPGRPEAARSGDLEPHRTPSVTFGGYRGADEARQQSIRGQASRQSVVRPSQPSGGRTPAGGKVSRDRQRGER